MAKCGVGISGGNVCFWVFYVAIWVVECFRWQCVLYVYRWQGV